MWRTTRTRSRRTGWLGLGTRRKPIKSGRSGRRGTIRRSAAWAAGAMLAITLLAGAGAAVIGVGRWWQHWEMPSPPVQSIRVQGLQRLSADEIRGLLPFEEGDRLFGLPLRVATHRLSNHPWIARATLHRSLSGAVVVTIQERQPIAVVRDEGGSWYVDQQGALLGPSDERPGPGDLAVSGLSLAQLRAGAPEERKRLQQGLVLLDVVRRDGVDVAEVMMRKDEAVLAFGGWRLHFRPGHYEEPWRRFWQVAERIPSDGRRVQDVDLRFANSVVVKM